MDNNIANIFWPALIQCRVIFSMSKEQIFDYFEPTLDKYYRRFVDFCIEFSLENGWFEKSEDKYALTLIGKLTTQIDNSCIGAVYL